MRKEPKRGRDQRLLTPTREEGKDLRRLIGEETGLGYAAAGLGDEDGYLHTGGVGNKVRVAGAIKGRRAAPLIDIEGEEVRSIDCVIPTGQIILQHRPQFRYVGPRIAHGDISILFHVSVRLHIPNSTLHKGSGIGAIQPCHGFIGHEDSGQVIIILKGIQHSLKSRQLGLVPVWVVLIKLGIEGVKVEEEVDANISKGRHAAVVIGGGIDVIDANGVGTKIGHLAGVELALGGGDERVLVGELVCHAWEYVRGDIAGIWWIIRGVGGKVAPLM